MFVHLIILFLMQMPLVIQPNSQK